MKQILKTIAITFIAILTLSCGTQKNKPVEKYQVGQIWEYKTRQGEENSKLTIVKTIKDPKLGLIICIQVNGLKLTNPINETGFQSDVPHLPFSEKAIEKSVTKLNSKTETLPDFKDGYNQWKTAFDNKQAGVFTISVSEAINAVQTTIDQASK